MNLNLKGLFFLSQAVARIMRDLNGGNIINIASTAGITPAQLPVYSISKAGVIMATKVMAREWAPYNIRVNAIAPGAIQTAMVEGFSQEEIETIIEDIPSGRLGTAEEVANSVEFLISEKSTYITGQVLAVNGGWLT